MTPIVFHPEARDEYKEAIRYYHGIDPDLQLGFRAEIGHQLRFIADNPLVPKLPLSHIWAPCRETDISRRAPRPSSPTLPSKVRPYKHPYLHGM